MKTLLLRQQQNIPAELREIFREEAEDHIKSIYAGLEQLENDAVDRGLVQEVRRAAHTLKGAAGAVGLSVVTQLSHRMEDLLDQLYDGNAQISPNLLSLLLATTDTLQDLCFGDFDQEKLKQDIVTHYTQYDAHIGEKDEDAPIAAESGRENAALEIPNIAFDTGVAPTGAIPIRRPVKKTPRSTGSHHAGQVLRVPITRLDALVRLASEMIINRTSFEQRLVDFVGHVEELQGILDRLRTVSHEMETRYSVDALRGQARNAGDDMNPVHPHFQVPPTRFEEFDALEFDRYTDFHLLSRTLAEATGDINTIHNELRTLIAEFDSLIVRQGRLSRDAQDRLLRIRMVPLATIATRLQRGVRQVATDQSKLVELVIDGEDTELDKTVLEEMADPLLHLLRNAVDHGVEAPELRSAAGKPDEAKIRVSAFHEGTQVVIRVCDDGAGLDPERIRATAVSRGLVGAEEAKALSVQELYPYIFVPGFSTASQVSEVSGRGVGMDIVRDKVQKLKGAIRVDSSPGRGTSFTIQLPMTLAVTRALMVITNNEKFAIPLQAVAQILRFERDSIAKQGAKPSIRVGQTTYPLVSLADHLGLNQTACRTSTTLPVLIVHSGDHRIALSVDRILPGRDIVVKTLGNHLQRVQGLIGATLLGDGTVVPILDPVDLVGNAETQVMQEISPHPRKTSSFQNNITVMIVDDSVSVRRVMSNLVKSAGWIAVTAKDGVDALETLQSLEHAPDAFLLDIEMPRMDGYELLARLREQDSFRNKPIIMVTSRAGEKHRQKAIDLGATDYVVKPYQDDALLLLLWQAVKQTHESALV